jgi:hypothetical protein
MSITSFRSTGLAFLAAGALTLLMAPLDADADCEATDRHEIPAFVLKRIEFAAEADRRASAAAAERQPAGH